MIIFNADDFGLTAIDSERIINVSSSGIIKSTTVVATTVSEKEIDRLKVLNISTGIHINLVEGKALSGVSSMTDDDGKFLPKKVLFKKILLGKISKKDMIYEIDLQFQRLFDLGVTITHIDTHQNIHIVPFIRQCIISVGDKYAVKKIRGQLSEYGWFKKSNIIKGFIKNSFCKYWHFSLPKDWIVTQSIVLNAPGLGREMNSIEKAVEMWEKGLGEFYEESRVYEVPCHLYLSEFEYRLYGSIEFKNMLEKLNIKIGNYNDI